MRLALDTNVLVYAEGVGDARRCGLARDLVARAPLDRTVVSAQALGELHRVLTRKAGRSVEDANRAVLQWAGLFDVADTRSDTLVAALDLSRAHGLQVWDAIIVASAAQAGCAVLFSEDMQDGFTWSGVTIVDPFAAPSALLRQALPP